MIAILTEEPPHTTGRAETAVLLLEGQLNEVEQA